MRGLWLLRGHRKVKRKESYKKCPISFAVFQKTISLYEFCQAKEDSFSPVKQLLPFWGNCNNNKSWNVLNSLALFCSGTYVRAWVILPDWGCCSCFNFRVKMKWWSVLPNLYHAEDSPPPPNITSFFSIWISTNSIFHIYRTCDCTMLLWLFKFVITVVINFWNQDAVFVFYIGSILGYSFFFANPGNVCYSLVTDNALRAGQRLFSPCLNTWEM